MTIDIHEAARSLMDRHSKPDWKKLSLDEWVCEYGEQIPESTRDEAYLLIDAFYN